MIWNDVLTVVNSGGTLLEAIGLLYLARLAWRKAWRRA